MATFHDQKKGIAEQQEKVHRQQMVPDMLVCAPSGIYLVVGAEGPPHRLMRGVIVSGRP
jgi:hypothetical protein